MANYVCDHCGYQSEKMEEVLSHLQKEHNINKPEMLGGIFQQDGKLFLINGEEITEIDLEEWLKDLLGDR